MTLISLTIILAPFYVYCLWKWDQFRTHFIIQNRYPQVVKLLMIAAIIYCFCLTIQSVFIETGLVESVYPPDHLFLDMQQRIVESSVLGLVYFIITFVYYRG